MSLTAFAKDKLVHVCLCIPDFGISTEPGIDLKLQPWLVFGFVKKFDLRD